MIEAVYKIGEIQEKQDFLEEFIEDIGKNYKHVFKIIVDIHDKKNPKYLGIEYEEFDPYKKMKYFYKRGTSGRAPDKTPTSKITNISKTLNTKIKNTFEKFFKENHFFLSEEEKEFIKNLHKLVNNQLELIKEELLNFTRQYGYLKNEETIKDGGVITFVFRKDGYNYYVGDMELFKNVFKKNENEAYRSFYEKSNIESRANNKYCYICKKQADEIWGFVNTYNFYTADKQSYVAGGFKQNLMWKNYPVCSDCAKVLERGKKYINENLLYRFCGFNYYVVPELIIENKELLNNVLLKTLKKYKEFSLSEKKSGLIEKVEEKILRELGKVSNQVNFNFLFFEKKSSAFNILLYLREIAPTRLNYLITVKDRVDNVKRQFDIFKEIKTKKDIINLNFSFSFIREFFPNSKKDGNFDKYFLEILNNIFINKNISLDFLISRFMDKIRKEFLNENWIEPLVLKSYKVLIYLEEINILKRRKNVMKNYGNNFEEFFKENPLLDDEAKKALFLEGVLVQKLLKIQKQERNATPFRNRLNGLKIDEKIAKRLFPEIINKLEEYGKNYYKELEEVLGEYLLKANFKKYPVDEMSYYFTLGMVLAKHF